MDEDERKDFARRVIEGHCEDVEWLSLFEYHESWNPDAELDDADAQKIMDLISNATVAITWE